MLGDHLLARGEAAGSELLKAADAVYEAEKHLVAAVELEAVPGALWTRLRGVPPSCQTTVVVARADVTTLRVDAVVNAANDAGLGCFRPQHRCIDSEIHRAAGPALREACRAEMLRRGGSAPLAAGTEALVTPGFHLPAKHVIHVTGPHVAASSEPSQADADKLAACYQHVLDAAVASASRSVAICCISTGLFGYPSNEAAAVAVAAVQTWLGGHPDALDVIAFNTFTAEDDDAYRGLLSDPGADFEPQMTHAGSPEDPQHRLAASWLGEADAVLIVAGSGMSVKDASSGENVYTDVDAFAKHYPFMPPHGYSSSYECMGLDGDARVPAEVKAGLWAKHMHNLGFVFQPNDGYALLKDVVDAKGAGNSWVLTSNVDRCFARSGFANVYEPQGTWANYQCAAPCRRDAVFPSRPILDRVLPAIGGDGALPRELRPTCGFCGGPLKGNVRGGNYFLHTAHDQDNRDLRAWVDRVVARKGRLVVLEVGAGFNTPTVTRFPAEAIVRGASAAGASAALVRINPDHASVPADLRAVGIRAGWQAVGGLHARKDVRVTAADEDAILKARTNLSDELAHFARTRGRSAVSWQQLLRQLI